MTSSKLIKAAAIAAISTASIFAAFETGTKITDASIAPGANHYKVYDASLNLTYPLYLEGNVVVDSGCTLVIRPGTWIYGLSAGGSSRSSNLIVAPGGYIDAQGTADSPIVFTGWGDDQRAPNAFGPGAKATWGGVVLIGNAEISDADTAYPEGVEKGDDRLVYGRSPRNNADNSGIMRYVSIRHGGTSIASNSEVNGLTFYGVGSGTTIDYIEVYSNYDDGYEWFGGTVNCKHLVSAFNFDDIFDLDDGYRGKGQFYFGIKESFEGNHCGEWDGKQAGQSLWSAPTLYNLTLIGSGSFSPEKSEGLYMCDSLGGIFRNSILVGVNNPTKVIDRQRHGSGANLMPLEFGYNGISDLVIQHWIFWDVDSGKTHTFADITTPTTDGAYMAANNVIINPKIRGIGREVANGYSLDPRLASTSPAFGYALPRPTGDTFFDSVGYVGAFDSTNLWCDKWTALYEDGILATAQFTNAKPKLVVSPSTCTRWKKEYAFPLQAIFENCGSVTPSSTNPANPKYHCLVDGVPKTALWNPVATADPTVRRVYQWYISAASSVAGSTPIVGPHVIDIQFPMTDGTVMSATARIWLY